MLQQPFSVSVFIVRVLFCVGSSVLRGSTSSSSSDWLYEEEATVWVTKSGV